LGVVGTRKLTAYGKQATEYIVSGLADSGMTIVSGLAMGIDAVAHQKALDDNIPTIAVLGSPVSDDGISPQVNYDLAQDILRSNGLLISEYNDKKDVFPSNFAHRDRIISGLSKGVLVIEAPEKSGALITTRFATEQNRDVFALPGNIFSINSLGPNMLIRKGAKPVFSAEDILGAYYQNLELNLEPKTDISTKNPVEQKIIDILVEKGEISVDEIIRASNLEPSQIIASLSILELKNKIKLKANKYSLNK
jgi:DNA processing protein